MRTLKKTLCFVLAVVMILGLGAFSVSAKTTEDYSDADEIKNTAAVDILGTIGVLEGFDTGDFQPEGTLTRAEAAKIITTMLGVTAVPGDMPFTDVPAGHWATNYIAYCAEQGIIAGYGDGTFGPDDALTGGAFAKMLLTALGYDATIEGLVDNAGWLINVAKLVRTADLDNGIDAFPYEEEITRDEAAQLAYNTLVAPLVTYNASTNVVVNGVPVIVNAGNAIYMTTAVRDTQTISYAQVNDGSSRGTYIVEFAEKYQPKLVRDTHDADDFGRPSTTWTYDRNKIDSYPNENMLVFSTHDKATGAEIYKAVGSDIVRLIGNSLNSGTTYFDIFVDGSALGSGTDLYKDAYDKIVNEKTGSSGELDLTGAGTQVEIYIDDDTYRGTGANTTRATVVTAVVVHTYLGEISSELSSAGEAIVTVVDEYTDEIAGKVLKVKSADVSNIGDFKEGDKVLVNMTVDSDPYKVRLVQAAEDAKDVAATAYTTSGGTMKTVTIEDGKKSIAAKALWNSDILKDYSLEELRGYTYDIYYDQYGNVIGINYNKTDSNYVFVVGVEYSSSYLAASTVKANVIWTDGRMETLTLKLSNNEKNTAKQYLAEVCDSGARGGSTNKGSSVVNRWFTSSTDDKGNVTLMDAVGTAYNSETDAWTASGDIRQAAITVTSTGKTPEISASDTSLRVATSRYAFGNDASVYITATADTKSIEDGAISKVNGVSTGIKNTSIKVSNNVADYANFDLIWGDDPTGATKGNNVFFVYDNSTSYVLYAVVISADAGGKVVYITTNGPTGREYVSGVGYVDTYGAIVDGTLTTVKVDSNRSATTATTTKLGYQGNTKDGDHLYLVSEDGDYIIFADAAKEDTLSTEDNRQNGYAFATGLTGKAGHRVYLKDGTLWVENTKSNEGYIVVDAAAKFFVKTSAASKYGNGEYTEYKSAASAISAATADGRYIAEVYAECSKSNGFANTVVFIAAGGSTGTSGGDSGIGLTEYPVNADWDETGAADVVVRYNETAPTAEDVKAELASLTGSAVSTLKRTGASTYTATMANGDVLYVRAQEVFVVTVDGMIYAEYDSGDNAAYETVKIPKGYYMLATDADGEIQTVNGTAIMGDGAGTAMTATIGLTSDGSTEIEVGEDSMATDLDLISIYQVTHGTGTTGFEYKNAQQATYASGTTNRYYPKGTTIAVTHADPDAFVTITNTDENATTETLVTRELYTEALTSADESATFELTEKTVIATTVQYHVVAPGVDGYYAEDDVVMFTAPVEDAKYALKQNVDDGEVAQASGTVTLTYIGSNAGYTVATSDNNGGEIELVQVVEITMTSGTATYTYGTAQDENVTSANFYVVGAVLTVTSATTINNVVKVDVNGAGNAAAVDSTATAANGTSPQVVSYTLKNTEYALEFTSAA